MTRLHTSILRQVSIGIDAIQRLVFLPHPDGRRKMPSRDGYQLEEAEDGGDGKRKKQDTAPADAQHHGEDTPPVFSLEGVIKNPVRVEKLRSLVLQLEGDFLRLSNFYSTCSSVLDGEGEGAEEEESTAERKTGALDRGRADHERHLDSNLAITAGVETAVSTLHMRVMASNTYGTAQVYVHPDEEGQQEEGKGAGQDAISFEVPCELQTRPVEGKRSRWKTWDESL